MTLSGLDGFREFADAFSTGGTDKFWYAIRNRKADEWEFGTGHLDTADTLVRDTVIDSSNSDNKVDFQSGTKDVLLDIPVSDMVLEAADLDLNGAGSTATKTLIVSGAGAWASSTNGATGPAQTEFTSNDIDLVEIEFTNSGSTEHAQVTTIMPDNWDGGVINAEFLWRTPASSGTVVWGLQGIAYSNDEAIDTSWGTRETVTDDAGSAGDDALWSPQTSDITLAGSPSGGDMVQFRISREAGNGSDDLSDSAFLIGVKIEYTESGYSH